MILDDPQAMYFAGSLADALEASRMAERRTRVSVPHTRATILAARRQAQPRAGRPWPIIIAGIILLAWHFL